MPQTESLQEFYQQKLNQVPENLQQEIGHFNVFRMKDCVVDNHLTVNYSRRDFYKVSLNTGHYLFHYADKTLEVKGPTLMFFSPQVPYSWEALTPDYEGFFCIFRAPFLTERMRMNINDLPMFSTSGKPAFSLTAEQHEETAVIYRKMLAEIASDYPFKYDLLCNYLKEIFHVALKMQPSETLYPHANANARLTAVFSDLLERQFPIESPAQRFTLRSASDYAQQLAVHVNHLNRAIRETTGKTTTSHIAERLAAEAKALLKHTSWNVAEISYALGFEEPAHFNNFFKKQTSLTPTAYRDV
ncbi:helix-turn-helix domain-containing protein [Chitinophaga nivalis]|uniref:Helix-turn-helix transcriptional regulator n=1 Tax=Chitinophaga nivalis TaxID=2991709 RepID=A0ABT3IGM0_9BACT|nr:helix-turn-helix domain-containing protein [Chitinophaga nivalis]MCW3467222.1 helix-turn-helix transcriptional regulator [Chitinophaga nivalis]MCW3483086.1 helix-turn-helix transcriptional regulator [Chitinophaga nivalis]